MNFLAMTMKHGARSPRAPLGLWVALLLLTMTMLTAVPAFAQTGNSVLLGRVTDASSKAPVADVVVTATSPALQGEQLVVTDASGQYRIPNLPPGDYTLRLEKETYRPYARGGIALRAGMTLRVNVELLPEALKAQEIIVVGRPPTVDIGSSSVAQSITDDFSRRVPVSPPGGKGAASRSFESIAAVTPGAKSDEFGTSIAGTSSPENQYVIDGLSVNDPAYGIIGTPLTMEFIKEVNVVSGGYMPEFGRATGGVLDVSTKSGGNELHGSVFFNITPGLLEGESTKVRRQGETIQTDDRLSSIRDYGFTVGGPILKDKLWFFGGLSLAFQSVTLERNLFATRYDAEGKPVVGEDGFNVIDRLPGSQRFDRAEERTLQYIGKLTYQIDPDHSVALSVYGSPTSSGGNGTYGFDPQQGAVQVSNLIGEYGPLAHEFIASSTDVALKWSSAFNNKTLLFDATLGWHSQRHGRLPPDGSKLGSSEGLAGVPMVIWQRTRKDNRPWRHSIDEFEALSPEAREMCEQRDVGDVRVVPCAVRSYWTGGPNFLEDSSQDRFQLKAMVTSIFEGLGHHVVKGGLDAEIMLYDHQKAYPGLVVYTESSDGSFFSDARQLGFLTGPEITDHVLQPTTEVSSLSTTIGGFVQDSWSILDKVTLNVGVRYDAQYLFDNDGELGMALPNQWSPRVGVVYDVTQQGRSKVFANYARYYESVPLDLVDRAFGDERQIRAYHRAASDYDDPNDPGCNPRDLEDALGTGPGQCMSHENRTEGTETASAYGITPASYDPNRHWIPTGGGKTPVDPDISPQSSDELVLGGEYEIIPTGRIGAMYTKRWMNNVIEDMSRDEASTYFIGNPGKGIAKDFPEPTRDYDALTLYFQKSFDDLWLAQASYTLSFLRGNYSGLFRPETNQLDPNITSDFDLTSLLDNREGYLPGDRRHELKVFGAKSFLLPRGDLVDLGLTFRSRSGGPTDFWGAHPLYGNDETFILPRGSGERLPWVHNVDGHIGYSVKLAKDSYLTVTMDVFNLFNFQAVTSTDQRYTVAYVDVRECRNGTFADLEPASGESCLKTLDGERFDKAADKNPNFGKPTSYQAPRQIRLGARVTF
ncbi:TonB-dependent receptor [Sorangium cellulosum]|uniref:TonB-dependent receptor n=2 Tax=Sorangium cellulosum TaxID=56 RepID=A0A4P2Q2I2_SORCE|nr:TonB-dependent receptor [Sorangium cellulosum]